jgi:hypothetical protein
MLPNIIHASLVFNLNFKNWNTNKKNLKKSYPTQGKSF